MKVEEAKYGNIRFLNRVSRTLLNNKSLSHDIFFLISGQKWKTHRKFLTPAFHYNILQSFLPVFLKNEKVLCEQLKSRADGSLIELFPILALTALDNITGTNRHTY